MTSTSPEPTPEAQDDLERAAAAVRAAPALALACHVSPDGDALGSMLAMHHLCRSQGIPSVAAWPSPADVAPHYAWLPGLDTTTKAADFPAEPDLVVTFDCGSMGRLGSLAPAAAHARDTGDLVVLDHHASNDRYGSINVVDMSAAATAVVVRRLADVLGWALTRDAAVCLYTGLVTDTGRFQYSNNTPEVFELACELSAFDLPIAAMSRALFEEHRFAYLKLVGRCLDRAELDHDLGLVVTWVTHDDLVAADVDVEETEGLIDIVRRTAEAEVSCVVKETPEGVRVSLRSIARVDVGAIACGFGGGGHRHAAGFSAPAGTPVTDVLASVRAAVGAAAD